MKLRIVLEDHKYQIERKGLFRWIKIGTKTPVGKTIQYPIKCETIDEAIEWANCYVEQQINEYKNLKTIIGYIEV